MWLALASGGVLLALRALMAIERAADDPSIRRLGCWIALALCVVAIVWNEAFSIGMSRWVEAERVVDWFLGSLEGLLPNLDETTPDRP